MTSSEKSLMAVIRASRPSFRNNHDKVAFAVHASFLTAGFVLTATGPPAFADDVLSSTSTEEVGIDQWNELEDEYAFLYVNPEKGNKKVLVKCLIMGDKLMVDVLGDGGDELFHLDIAVGEFVSENPGSDYNSQYKNLGKLVGSLESEILSKLNGSSGAGSTSGDSRLRVSEEPSRNEHEPHTSGGNPAGFVVPPVYPVGGSDLFPGGGAGVYPTRGGFGGGSMLLGPQDPSWFGGRGGFSGIPGSGGPNVPPGARFDPYGPPDVPGFGPGGPGQFGRFPRGPMPGGRPDPDLQPGLGGRRIHPDLEQPGTGGDFDYI